MVVKQNNLDKDLDIEKIKDLSVHDVNILKQYKIVYWGCGESGKTTNYRKLSYEFYDSKVSKSISVETTDGRTLLNDHYILYLVQGDIGFLIHVVTCTGQERFLQTREYYLEGADGVVFVGDSDPKKIEQNKRSFRELKAFTNRNEIPYVIQLNKRDLKDKISLKDFKKHLNLPSTNKYSDGSPVIYPAIATKGENVVPCFLDLILQLLTKSFKK